MRAKTHGKKHNRPKIREINFEKIATENRSEQFAEHAESGHIGAVNFFVLYLNEMWTSIPEQCEYSATE